MKKLFIALILVIGAFVLLQQSNILARSPLSEGSQQTKISNQIQNIDIELSGASAKLIPYNGNHLRTELKGKGKVTVYKKGDTIEVDYKRNWFEGLGFFNNTKLNIYIPKDYNRKMEFDIGSGDLKTSGYSKDTPLKLDELNVDLGSGNVTFESIIANTFKQEVSSGNVQINYLVAPNTSFDISSGNVNLQHFSGGIETDISSGHLDLQMDKLEGNIEVEINSGSASLDLPKTADFKLYGEVSSGSIQNNFTLKDFVEDRNQIKGIHRNGKYLIQLDVSSGKIDIH
jgi:lia operon protein LiaG